MKFRLYMQLMKESLLMALHSLVNNKLRSLLSVLGITIGIFSIITVFTAVDSLEINIKSSVESLGKAVIYIDKWQWSGGNNDYPWWKYINRPNATLNEKNALEELPVMSLIEAVSYHTSSNTSARYKDEF